jgi:hypothetical protein
MRRSSRSAILDVFFREQLELLGFWRTDDTHTTAHRGITPEAALRQNAP